MQEHQLKYWIAFNRIRGIGRVRFKLLESHFDSIEAAWSINGAQLRAAGLVSEYRMDEWELIQKVQQIGEDLLARSGVSFPSRWPIL